MLLAAYGSLKKGYYNHSLLEGAEYLGNSSVYGVMYSNGSYPKLYKVENDDYDSNFRLPLEKKHQTEIYRLTDAQFAPIERMELGAGYETEEIETEYGPAKIFYMPHKNFNSNDEWVASY